MWLSLPHNIHGAIHQEQNWQFGCFVSQPVEWVIEQINPILRGWVNYFAIGNSSRCFAYVRRWVEKNIRRHLARSSKRQGFGWKRDYGEPYPGT
jgi:RNA-directed DNA polymerase